MALKIKFATHPSSLIPHPSSLIPHPCRGWPILHLEIHAAICYARRSVPLVFFGNPINENQRGNAIPKRGKIAILTPKIEELQPADRGKIAI
jgi:hypothetical protein